MNKKVKRMIALVFLSLTGGVIFNLHFLQFANSNGDIGPRLAANLAPVEPQQKLGPEDAIATPDKGMGQGVIVLNAGIKTSVTQAIQNALAAVGYDVGDVDGVPSLATRAAIMAYEHDNGFPLTGTPTRALLKQLNSGVAQIEPLLVENHENIRALQNQREQVVRTVQQSLYSVGYSPGKIDGRMGEATARAIREFEIDQNLPETGRISGRLISRLATLAGLGRLASR